MTRTFGAVFAADGDRLLLWAPGYTPDDGSWMQAPEGLPAELRYEGATFEVEFADSEERPGSPWSGTFFHQFRCDCSIHTAASSRSPGPRP